MSDTEEASTTNVAEYEKSLSSSSVESELEEDDLELIKENMGGGFLRLQPKQEEVKRDVQMEQEEEGSMDEEEEEEEGIFRVKRKRVAKEELEKLFEEDEEESKSKVVGEKTAEYNYSKEREIFDDEDEEEEDELGDFIADEEEDGEGDRPSVRKSQKDRQKSSGQRTFLEDTFGTKLPPRILHDIMDIFGDGTDYLGLADDDYSSDEEEAEVEESSDKEISLKKQQTTKVTESLVVDIPERILKRDGVDRPLPEENELIEEASWITCKWLSDPTLNSKFTSVDNEALNSSITAILSLFRVEMLEVPTVATHYKEIFQHLMGLNDLWSIWDLDEQWKLLEHSKTLALKSLNSSDPEYSSLEYFIKSSDRLDAVEIAAEYIKRKNSGKFNLNNKNIELAILEYSISPVEFAENLKNQQAIHTVPSGSSAISPQTCTSHLASLLGMHPSSAFLIRVNLELMAAINVIPSSRGFIEISDSHELSSVKFIKEKPVVSFSEDQFLLIVKGQLSGLLNYEVIFPRLEEVMEYWQSLFGATPTDDNAGDEWVDIRREALEKAVKEFIIPKLKRNVSSHLRSLAEKWLVTSIQYNLQDKLMTRPYDPDSQGHYRSNSRGFKVAAVSWGKGGNGALVNLALIDERGRCLEQHRFTTQQSHGHPIIRPEELTRLAEFLQDVNPVCIAVAGQSIDTRYLFEDLSKFVQSLNKSSKTSKKSFIPPSVIYAHDDTGRAFMNSSKARREWPDSSPLMRYCISVGRRLINPLFEYCSLSETELLLLNSHPLLNLVSKELYSLHVNRAIVNVVNLIGVDLNAAIDSPWMRSPLQFICGLGPRSAETFLKKLSTEGVVKRTDLESIVGPRCFKNCASFIKITKKEADPLDATRIHPMNYILARKIATDAMEYEDCDMEEEEIQKAVKSVLRQPAKLDDLLLDEYAKELVKQGQSSKHLTLHDIKAELQNPYAELRSVNNGPDVDELFEMLSGESEFTLWIGMVIRAQITRQLDKHFYEVKFENGLLGRLDADRVKSGMIVNARVCGVNPAKFEIEVRELRSGESSSSLPRLPRDPFYDREGARNFEKSTSVSTSDISKSSTLAIPRPVVHHPIFKNITRVEAEEELRNAPCAEAILRPSSQSPRHVTLTWKVADSISGPIYQHILIECKMPKGFIAGSQVYEDLDEIIARHVEGVYGFIKDIQTIPKYFSVLASSEPPLKQIESHLATQRLADSNRIAYCLSLSLDHPGNVLLSYQPNQRVYHEIIKIRPSGYILRNESFIAVEALISWFKQNWNKPVELEKDRVDRRGGEERRRDYRRDDGSRRDDYRRR